MEPFGNEGIFGVFFGERRELQRLFDEPVRAGGSLADEFPDVVDEVGGGGGLKGVLERFLSGGIVFILGLSKLVAENLAELGPIGVEDVDVKLVSKQVRVFDAGPRLAAIV